MSMGLRFDSFVLVSALVLGACGPQGPKEGDDDSSTGDATDASRGDTSDGDTSDGDTSDGDTEPTAESGSTGEDLCLPAYDEEGNGLTVITLRNDTADVLFVGRNACQLEPFDMLDAAAEPVGWQSSDCAITCEAVIAGDCFYCGPCEGPTLLRLAPGESWERSWDGRRYDRVEFPAGCLEEPCEANCEHATVAAAGSYTVRASARTDCGALDPGDCECPDGAGTCALVLPGGEVLPATQEVTLELAHPSATAELVFE